MTEKALNIELEVFTGQHVAKSVLKVPYTPKVTQFLYLLAHSRESETFVDFREKVSFFIGPHILSRFLSHQFVTWYLRSISKTKIAKLFCPCMSEHMIFIKNVTNVTQAVPWLHQNVTNVTKQNIASKEILMIEFHEIVCKYVVRHLCIAQYKIP